MNPGDARTATVSLALNDADTHNGCLRVVPGSHAEPALRRHRPLIQSREGALGRYGADGDCGMNEMLGTGIRRLTTAGTHPNTTENTHIRDPDSICRLIDPQPHPKHPPTQQKTDAHALTVDLRKGDRVLYLPLRRGDVTVHDERIVHGSDGNASATRTRKTYVVAFRSEVCGARGGGKHSPPPNYMYCTDPKPV